MHGLALLVGASWTAAVAASGGESAPAQPSEILRSAVHAPAPSVAPPDFATEVRPILADNCVVCHGPDEAARESGLRLDRPGGADADGWLTDLGGSAAVVPGDPEASELIRRVRADGRRRMPPRSHSEPLSEDEIDVLTRWIEAGAPYDLHWSYQPFRAIEVPDAPAGLAGWDRNPIDAFVARRAREVGLEPQPEASRRTLLRRVSLDLTGLPPSPEELSAFESDPRADAYEREVERLLATEAYAEHWTRQWMDLARYADSHGFTIDGGRNMWPWRDWVLRSIHADEPYDAFTIRQLAGDLLPNATSADVIATGFHRNTLVNQEGGAKDEENRVNAVHDRVATTGAVWLGTTTSCAQCHDHKYDPFSDEDYYRLFAYYNSTEDGGVHASPSAFVGGRPEDEAVIAGYERGVRESRRRLEEAAEAAAPGWTTWVATHRKADNGPELVPQLDGAIRVYGQNAVFTTYALTGPAPTAGVAMLRVEALPEAGLAGLGPGRTNGGNFVLTGLRVEARAADGGEWRSLALANPLADFEQDGTDEGLGKHPAVDVLDDDDRTGWAIRPAFGRPHVLEVELATPLPAGDHELRVALEQRFGDHHSLGRFRLRTRPDVPSGERATPTVPEAWVAAFDEHVRAVRARPRLHQSLVLRERRVPRQTHVFLRGSYLDPGEPVTPGVPAALAHLAPLDPPGDGGGANRLQLARWLVHPENALVHRVTVNRWWQAFFGTGLVATENDFGLRGAAPSHPDLLEWLAQAFVEDGFSRKALHRRIVTSATYRQAVPAGVSSADPENRELARQRRLRLTAESIRDSALAASGLLFASFGGQPVQPPQPDGVYAFTQHGKQWKTSEGPLRYRRTLYTRIYRSSVFPFLTTFDAPEPTVTCTRRERSTSPLQALAMANDPMILELAAGLGARARTEGEDDEASLARAFELALGRPPGATDAHILRAHLAGARERALAGGSEAEDAERAAWSAVGRVLLNLEEFLTRP